METLLNCLAPACIILGALLTASNLGSRITGIGFIAFTLGSLAWLGIGLIAGPFSLVWQNIVLVLLNGFGIWRWLGRETKMERGGKVAQRRSEASDDETLFPASLLSRADLIGGNGERLGSTVDAMVGCRSGRLRYLVVSAGGVAGLGETLRRVDWTSVQVDGDALTTDLSELETRPELQRDQWPSR